jgi:hypothetical protein
VGSSASVTSTMPPCRVSASPLSGQQRLLLPGVPRHRRTRHSSAPRTRSQCVDGGTGHRSSGSAIRRGLSASGS